ncbi:MAG: hypothetical protein KVP17_003108 [Porospora cf. gigantea B]|uniref:uncharacterized protein n=1 Tax=Porospora cf. gigantea B TaxID=2853592 RepID=UPI003571F672|nr:MAG: hypothetical protein KVP17_003108 [Porospora cf. gigantea B]
MGPYAGAQEGSQTLGSWIPESATVCQARFGDTDDEECPGNPCSSSGLYTGTCTEILGTYECNCTDPQGKHPDGGLNGTDWTVCVPGQLCSMGLCDDKFDSFIALVGTNDTDGVYVHHNPYDRSCVDDSQWGATCGCTTGFRNKGTLSALECEDIDECAEDALGSCGANTICTNVLGSWMCQCNFGLEDPAYTASFEGPKNCADINECELGVFRLDGMVSVRDHRNNQQTACNMYAGMCVNSDMLTTGAAYSCLCYDGWEAKAQITDSDIQTGCSDCCEDIDECARGTHQCEETCFQGVVSDPVGTNYTCDCGTQRFLISEISCTGCEYDGWLNWSDCSKDCGLGVKSRVGMVTQPRDDNPFIRKTPQETCVKTQESQCFVDFCKEDLCSYSSWTSWTDCSRPCGGGEMSRERSLSEGESSYCTEPLVETDTCNTQSCTGIMLKVVRHPAFLAGVAAIVLIALVTAGVCIHRHIRIKR